MKTRNLDSRPIVALVVLAFLALTCGTPSTALTPTATTPIDTPPSGSGTLSTTLTLSAPDGSSEVTGTLKNQDGTPVTGASIEITATALEGVGLLAEYTLTGTVPADAKQANVGFRINTECDCTGTSDFFLYDVRFVQEDETTNRVPNSNFAKGLDGWGFWGDGTALLQPSDQGPGQMLHVTATPSQPAAINSTRFPVSAGSEYTLTFSARVNPVSAGSGYFDIVFLKSGNEGTRETIPLKAATAQIGSATTDSDGVFRFSLSQLPAGKFRLEARYAGDDRTSPAKVTATVLGPTPIPTIAPTPMPSELVWFGPNMGSTDFPELFSKPEQWAEARSRINVLKFFQQNVLDVPCAICGDNTLNKFVSVDAFRKLTEWGIAIDIDLGAVKEWGCGDGQEFRNAKTAIDNIQRNGGVVSILDMDEPFMGGELVANGQTCGFTMEQSADATARFIQQIKAAYPNILIGDTEPYPYFSVEEIEQWILALEARGVTLAHFHLDVDPVYVRELKLGLAGDLRELSRFFEEHRIPFGVIFIAEWPDSGSNCSYFNSAMTWIRTVNQAIGKTPHLLFQSWQGDPADRANKLLHWVPDNLPENDPAICSHTRLILEGLAVFEQ